MGIRVTSSQQFRKVGDLEVTEIVRNVALDSGRFKVVTRQKCSFDSDFGEEIKRGLLVSVTEYMLLCVHKLCHIYLFVSDCVCGYVLSLLHLFVIHLNK